MVSVRAYEEGLRAGAALLSPDLAWEKVLALTPSPAHHPNSGSPEVGDFSESYQLAKFGCNLDMSHATKLVTFSKASRSTIKTLDPQK